jgi:hypothetical protein
MLASIQCRTIYLLVCCVKIVKLAEENIWTEEG